jgi:hypothetical protein
MSLGVTVTPVHHVRQHSKQTQHTQHTIRSRENNCIEALNANLLGTHSPVVALSHIPGHNTINELSKNETLALSIHDRVFLHRSSDLPDFGLGKISDKTCRQKVSKQQQNKQKQANEETSHRPAGRPVQALKSTWTTIILKFDQKVKFLIYLLYCDNYLPQNYHSQPI